MKWYPNLKNIPDEQSIDKKSQMEYAKNVFQEHMQSGLMKQSVLS